MIVYLIVLFVVKSEASLNLIFSDEFNGNNSIDQKNWILDGPHCEHMNTSTNCGLELINETLVLVDLEHKCLETKYVSPIIEAKDTFTYGRFEFRVALPRADNLYFLVYLEPLNNTGNPLIKIIFRTQNEIKYGFEFENEEGFVENYLEYDVQQVLNGFHTYAFEWTETQMEFILNDEVLSSFNITEELEDNDYNPFDKPFKLKFVLKKFIFDEDEEELGIYKDDQWCPLLIIDYIRIYQFDSDDTFSFDGIEYPINNNITSSYICEQLMASIRPVSESWKLIFSDEFYDNTIDENNWSVRHQINYPENVIQNSTQPISTSILTVSDGALIIGTSPDTSKQVQSSTFWITTKKVFTYGKFEIRAAIPEGMVLKPSIYLETLQSTKIKSHTIERFSIVSYTHSDGLSYGIHYPEDQNRTKSYKLGNTSVITDSLFDFHTYVMEWTENEILWFIDDNPLTRTRFSKTYETFCKTFKLSIRLEITDPHINDPLHIDSGNDTSNTCPLLILDYVRVYQTVHDTITNGTSTNFVLPVQNTTNSTNICNNIKLSEKIEIEPASNYLISIITISSIILVIIIIIIIALNVCLYKRVKNKRKATEKDKQKENDYDDVLDLDNIYDDPYQANNEYDDYNYAGVEEYQDIIYKDKYYTEPNEEYEHKTTDDYLELKADYPKSVNSKANHLNPDYIKPEKTKKVSLVSFNPISDNYVKPDNTDSKESPYLTETQIAEFKRTASQKAKSQLTKSQKAKDKLAESHLAETQKAEFQMAISQLANIQKAEYQEYPGDMYADSGNPDEPTPDYPKSDYMKPDLPKIEIID